MKRLVIGIAFAALIGWPTLAYGQPTAMDPAMAPAAPTAPAMAPAPTMAPTPATMAPVAPASPAMATEPVPMAPAQPAATEPAKPAAKADTGCAGGKDPWWKVLLGGLVQIVLLFALSILVMLGNFAVKWLAKKMKITDQEQIKMMNGLYDAAITFGVNYASQQAYKLRDDPDTKGKRLDWAVDKAMEMIKEYKLPEKTAGWIQDKIEAKIGETERKPDSQ